MPTVCALQKLQYSERKALQRKHLQAVFVLLMTYRKERLHNIFRALLPPVQP